MRFLALVPLAMLAACDASDQPQQKAEAPAAAQLQGGQWELATEVTQFANTDNGKAKIDTPVGTKDSSSHCVAVADAKKPDPSFFGGPKDSCKYGDFYMSGGRLSATVNCNRPGLNGNIATRVDADYTTSTITGTLSTTTYLTSDGDVQITRKLTGHHAGACTAPASGGGKKA